MTVDHRSLGVQLNNSTWVAIDEATVTADSPKDEQETLLYGAYASAYHWRQVGTVANRARAEHLIARTALVVGLADVALRHARRCLDLVESHPDVTEDWDLGFALEALARAEAATGQPSAESTRLRAEEACARIEDPDDRAIVEAQLHGGDRPR